MANPTTNFGWVMPTATDLVTDLPADFAVFGQGVDTSMAYLLGGTTGQILSKTSATNMAFTWINNDQGDITGITATSPLTGGGSSGAITVGIQDATTSVKGSVQLSDSTSTTSSVLAATPTAVKSAYDLADAAIAKTTVTTAGDIIYRNATVPARLGIGTVGQVLTVNSGATAPEWSTAASSTTNWSLINSGGTALTGAQTITISSISGANKLLVLIVGASASASAYMSVIFNGDTAGNYTAAGLRQTVPSTYAVTNWEDMGDAARININVGRLSTNAASVLSAYCISDGCNASGVKSFVAGGGMTSAGGTGGETWQTGGVWRGSATVSSVGIQSGAGNFDAGTVYIYQSA